MVPIAEENDNNLSRKALIHETEDDLKNDDDDKKTVHINTHSVDGENVIYKANNASRSPKDTEGLASRIHTTSDMERYVALVHAKMTSSPGTSGNHSNSRSTSMAERQDASRQQNNSQVGKRIQVHTTPLNIPTQERGRKCLN